MKEIGVSLDASDEAVMSGSAPACAAPSNSVTDFVMITKDQGSG